MKIDVINVLEFITFDFFKEHSLRSLMYETKKNAHILRKWIDHI